jgi:protein SCO1/2
LYARVQDQLTDRAKRNIQLLSLSIDPLGDDPKALFEWLKRFDAREGWIAAAPAVAALTEMTALFKGRAALPDTHSGQVYLIRRDARLVWRTADLPAPRDVADLLLTLSEITRRVPSLA